MREESGEGRKEGKQRGRRGEGEEGRGGGGGERGRRRGEGEEEGSRGGWEKGSKGDKQNDNRMEISHVTLLPSPTVPPVMSRAALATTTASER